MSSSTSIILVRPTADGNVGAAARAMANMGLEQMILVEPAVELGDQARAMAVGAAGILDKAVRADSLAQALAPFHRAVGTTSHRARQLEIPLLLPKDLPEILKSDPAETSTALVFGPERTGLTTEELTLCSPLVRIPCSTKHPTLNLAQAVLIIAWELSQSDLSAQTGTAVASEPTATAGEIQGLFSQATPLLAAVGFSRDDTFESVLRDLRQLAARAALTQREVQILRGICRRAQYTLESGGGDRRA